MQNEALVKELLPLMQAQMHSIQRELGLLLAGTNTPVSHANPGHREEIQDRLNCARQGLVLVYLFAMWEEYVERDVEKQWLPPEKLERLNAFRHVRHCAAHGFDGARARQCRSEFESVMNSAEPFPNLPWTPSAISLADSQVAIDCWRFMEDLTKVLIDRIANSANR